MLRLILLLSASTAAAAMATSAARCAEQLARGLGPRITHLTVRPHAVPGQDVADVLRIFAQEVVPRVLRMKGMAGPP